MDYSFTGSDVQTRVAPSEARHIESTRPERRAGVPIAAIAVMQSILFLGHWLLFRNFTSFLHIPSHAKPWLAGILIVHSES